MDNEETHGEEYAGAKKQNAGNVILEVIVTVFLLVVFVFFLVKFLFF